MAKEENPMNDELADAFQRFIIERFNAWSTDEECEKALCRIAAKGDPGARFTLFVRALSMDSVTFNFSGIRVTDEKLLGEIHGFFTSLGYHQQKFYKPLLVFAKGSEAVRLTVTLEASGDLIVTLNFHEAFYPKMK